MEPHRKGFFLTFAGVLTLCPDTLLIRLVDADPWIVLVWRGGLTAVGLSALFLLLERRNWRRSLCRLGWSGLAGGLLFSGNSAGFVVALAHTGVANLLAILAATPFIAALFSHLFLGERTPSRTWIAMTAALVGIVVIFAGSWRGGAARGDLLALATAACIAGFFTLARARRDVNMMPAVIVGVLLSMGYGLALAPTMALSAAQLGWLAAMGLIVQPVSFALIMLGLRCIPAPEAALLLRLETVVGPLLVWAVLAEAPPPATLIGGAVVIAALTFHSLSTLRAGPADAARLS